MMQNHKLPWHALLLCLRSSCLASEVIAWLRSMGGTAHGLQLADFADMGRGLRCEERVLASCQIGFEHFPQGQASSWNMYPGSA